MRLRTAAAATIAIDLAELLHAPLVQTTRAASADQNLQASMVTAANAADAPTALAQKRRNWQLAAVATFAVALAELTP